MPIEPLNNVMHVTAGMGDTGETYVIGKDKLMRSDSRFIEGRSFLMIIGLIIMCVILLVGLVLDFDISSSIKKVTQTMVKLTENKLDTDISMSGRRDEVGEMEQALTVFKKMPKRKKHCINSYITSHITIILQASLLENF